MTNICTPQKFRWSKVYESSEEELLELLESKGLTASRLTVEEPMTQSTASSQTIWCAEGSFSLQSESATLSMQPGDAVTVPPNTDYSLLPGMFGGAYYLTD